MFTHRFLSLTHCLLRSYWHFFVVCMSSICVAFPLMLSLLDFTPFLSRTKPGTPHSDWPYALALQLKQSRTIRPHVPTYLGAAHFTIFYIDAFSLFIFVLTSFGRQCLMVGPILLTRPEGWASRPSLF